MTIKHEKVEENAKVCAIDIQGKEKQKEMENEVLNENSMKYIT